MLRPKFRMPRFRPSRLAATCFAIGVGVSLGARPVPSGEPVLEDQTYMPVKIDESFQAIMERDTAAKPKLVQRQQKLLEERYDLRNDASDVMMSAGRKAVQQGVRVKLPTGTAWDDLAAMSPEEIKRKNLFPKGFRPLPHVHHKTGGQVFPKNQIDAMQELEQRSLKRFDADFDLPDHLAPEFPPPIFLTSRPDLGDVSQGKVLSIKNYYALLKGKLTPVQMDGLLSPGPETGRIRHAPQGQGDGTGVERPGGLLRQRPLCRVSRTPVLSRRQNARFASGTVLRT